jgi:hypothetical protein
LGKVLFATTVGLGRQAKVTVRGFDRALKNRRGHTAPGAGVCLQSVAQHWPLFATTFGRLGRSNTFNFVVKSLAMLPLVFSN